VCIVCNVPKAETSFNLAEDMLRADNRRQEASDDASSSFALHVAPRPETEFGSCVLCCVIRHVRMAAKRLVA
jgi:hypothetical protein